MRFLPRKTHGTAHGDSIRVVFSVKRPGDLSRRSSESEDGSVVVPEAEQHFGYTDPSPGQRLG